MFYAYLMQLNKCFWGNYHGDVFISYKANILEARFYVYIAILFPHHSSVTAVSYYNMVVKGTRAIDKMTVQWLEKAKAFLCLSFSFFICRF